MAIKEDNTRHKIPPYHAITKKALSVGRLLEQRAEIAQTAQMRHMKVSSQCKEIWGYVHSSHRPKYIPCVKVGQVERIINEERFRILGE